MLAAAEEAVRAREATREKLLAVAGGGGGAGRVHGANASLTHEGTGLSAFFLKPWQRLKPFFFFKSWKG